jgi:hypothetical protein
LAECYCGASLSTSASGVGAKVADAVCRSMACSGDGSQGCGDGGRLRLFKRVPSLTASLPSGWQAKGCTSCSNPEGARELRAAVTPFASRLTAALLVRSLLAGVVDGSARLLTGSYASLRSTNSPAACIAACAAGGFTYAGLENGDRAFRPASATAFWAPTQMLTCALDPLAQSAIAAQSSTPQETSAHLPATQPAKPSPVRATERKRAAAPGFCGSLSRPR